MRRIARFLKKYFIPHEGNDHQPHLLRPRTVAAMCVVALLAEIVFVFGSSYIAPRSQLFGVVLVNSLVDETNENRVANHLSALRVNAELQAAAQAKANDMVTKNYFAHTSPDGVTPWYWFQQVGYDFAYAGENLAVNFSNSEDVTNAWMNSPGHRANILNGNFAEIGMATAQGTRNGVPATYVVELFGTPASAPIAFVDQAKAATAPTPAPAPAPTPAKTPSTPVVKKKPPTPAPTPVASATPSTPTVVAISDTPTPTGEETFVAVKGAEAAAPVPAPAAGSVQGNALQRLFANPKQMANIFYFLVMIVFAIGMVLNIFIKMRVQHPHLILGGAIVMVVTGMFVLVNQNFALLHAVIR